MTYQKPPGSLVILEKTSRSLIINIPSLDSSKSGQILLCFMAVAVCLINLFLLRVFSSDKIELMRNLLGLLLGNLVYLPFLRYAFGNHLKISKDEFFINWNLCFFSRTIKAQTKDVKKVYLEKDLLLSSPDSKKITHITFCLLKARKEYRLGYILSQKEQKWLFSEIRDFLEQLKTQ